MTQGRLEALLKLSNDILFTEDIITKLKRAECLCVCEYLYLEGVPNKLLIDTLEEDADLRTLITKYYEDKLAKLRKEFEEA